MAVAIIYVYRMTVLIYITFTTISHADTAKPPLTRVLLISPYPFEVRVKNRSMATRGRAI